MNEARLYNWNDLPKDSPRKGVERVAFRGEHAMVVSATRCSTASPGPWCASRRTWCITRCR
jgi:hypothetical protein